MNDYFLLERFLRESLKKHGYCTVPVKGDSMLPTIKSGEKVKVNLTTFASLDVGDVIAFTYSEKIFIHRIHFIFPDYIITAGDNNLLLDKPIYYNNILGKVDLEKENFQLIESKKERNLVGGPQIFLTDTLFGEYKRFAHLISVPVSTISSGSVKFTPSNSIGISPFGLSKEDALISFLKREDKANIVCMAPFAKISDSNYFSVDNLSGVIRLDIFERYGDFGIDQFGLLHLLAYVEGLIKSATKVQGEK
jgi:signal peptidase I